MKILIVGDVHLKKSSSISYFNKPVEDNITLELKRGLDSLEFVRQVAEEENVNLIIFLGDIFHTLGIQDNTVIYEAVKAFSKFSDFDVLVLAGNHDVVYKEKSLIEILPVRYKVTQYLVEEFYLDSDYTSISVAYVPYIDDTDKLSEWLAKSSTADLVFTHWDLNNYSKRLNKINDYYLKDNESDVLDLSSTKFISGHIHKRFKDNLILNVGSLYQNTVAEYQQQGKGVYLLNLISKDKIRIKFIENKVAPKIIPVNYKSELNIDKLYDENGKDDVFVFYVYNEKDLIELKNRLTGRGRYRIIKKITKSNSVKRSVESMDSKQLLLSYMEQVHSDIYDEFKSLVEEEL